MSVFQPMCRAALITMKPILCALFSLPLFTACASVWLNSDLPLLRLSPSALAPHTATQRVTLSYSDKPQTFDAVIETEDGKLTIIGMAFGARLFGINYDGVRLTADKEPPSGLSAQRIVNDWLIVAAPLHALQAALPEHCSARDTAAPKQRDIECDGKPLIQVVYSADSPWQGKTTFTHRRLRYSLTLMTREI
jgi:hypothetical protein